tara:strand:- start:1408 stop:1548 length:141 start_codon:yes stop_codon:yes gene_type:complete
MCYKQFNINNEVKEPQEQYQTLKTKLRFFAQLEYERYLMKKKCKTQ